MNLSDLDVGTLISLAALLVSGLAAVLGMWIERDDERPVRLFYGLVVLCLLATGVSMWQAIGDAQDAAQMEENMANVLQKLDTIMQKEGVEVPAINDLVKSELAAASQSNPDMIRKMAQRISDSGGNPAEVLGSYLPAADVARMQRGGNLVVKSSAKGVAVPAEPRRTLQFGGGPAALRSDAVTASAPPAPIPVMSAAPEPPPAPSASVAPMAAPESPTAHAPPQSTPIPTPKPVKPVAAKAAAPADDVDIYEEADKDLRRKKP